MQAGTRKHLIEAQPILRAGGGEVTRDLPVNRKIAKAAASHAAQQERTAPRNSGRIGENKIVPTARSSTSSNAVSSSEATYIRKNLYTNSERGWIKCTESIERDGIEPAYSSRALSICACKAAKAAESHTLMVRMGAIQSASA